MTATLETALRTLKLEPGRVYTYHVDDVWVELRVSGAPPVLWPNPISEEDVMLDPWVELTGRFAGKTVRAVPGVFPLPDSPKIPEDEE